MAKKIKHRPGYTKTKITTRRGKRAFRWMRDQVPTWSEIRGPKAGPAAPGKRAGGNALGCGPSSAWPDTSANRRLLAFNAAHGAASEVLKIAAQSDSRFKGLSAKHVAPRDLRRLETETASFLDLAEARSLLADELRRPELADLRNRQGLDVLEYSFALGGLHFALARLGSGHPAAFEYLDEPWRSEGIAAARAYGQLDPSIDPFGGVRLYPAEEYLEDVDLTE